MGRSSGASMNALEEVVLCIHMCALVYRSKTSSVYCSPNHVFLFCISFCDLFLFLISFAEISRKWDWPHPLHSATRPLVKKDPNSQVTNSRIPLDSKIVFWERLNFFSGTGGRNFLAALATRLLILPQEVYAAPICLITYQVLI